ncbi:ABC transporter permease [Hyphomicrobium sp. 2TAF46]|uniref:ABC transporter permease n=1 Tax=Hyphomicrobium sp. 2TAF46 TaxID=3233019 RepID=UPI003F916E0A
MDKRITLATAAALLAVIGLLPLLTMLINSVVVDGAFSLKAYQALWSSGGDQLSLMRHSLLLSLAVTVLATIAGVPLGVLLGKTDLPYRGPLTVVLTLPLLIPPYVLAVAWFAVLGSAGWISSWAPEASRSLSAALFGPLGCMSVLFTTFVPIVILLTIAYLGAVNPRLEDAGRLVSPWPAVLRRITLPLIAPAILFAAVLVFLLTLGELGVPTYLRFPVYAVETMTQFAAFYDFSAATAAAMPLLVVTLGVLAIEYRLLHGQGSELRTVTFEGARNEIRLGRWRTPLLALVLAWSAVTVVLPLAVLIAQSWSLDAYAEAFARAGASILRSLVFAAVGATLLTFLGFFLGYLIHHRALPIWRNVDALTLFLFTLPGTVVGIGLISLWNRPMTNIIYATPAIVIFGYLAQYAVLPTRMTSAILDRIPRSLEAAAQMSGAGWFMTLREIIVPLARRGLIATWIIAYGFCLRDLGVSMVVYPPGSDTLPVRILTLMANGTPSMIAALCVILIGITLLPLGAAALLAGHGRRRARA